MNVGFIGLGNMGQPMARNLLKAGHHLLVYNRTRSRAEELLAEGARLAESARDACRGDVVITMLADDRAVEEVVTGADLVSNLAPNTVHVSMSTLSVALSRRLAELHAQAGRAYVSAPVFGRPEAAAAAKLFIVAAGPAAAIDQCRPLFEALGQTTFVVGLDAPAANVVKLAGNFLIASLLESLGEAVALVRKSGVDPKRFLEIMTDSLFAAPVYKTYGSIIVQQRYQPAGFKVPLGLKDVRLILAAAEAAAVPMPIASLVRDRLLTAIAQGHQDLDWSVVARIAAENAGL
ncbi:MAG: 6-phosphogluconate dehydrogenase [Acidobacteria bacterium]|nr:MAG: 6-phosphogluconate dehydrogenase [Acidobacteriota bacterium]